MHVGETLHHAQSQSHGEAALVVGGLERAIPTRGIGADGSDLDAVVARVADDLGRRIKAHRLRVQERRAEHIRMPAFEPGRGVGDQGERGCVAFRKSVRAEAFQLLEGLLGEIRRVAARHHAIDQLGLEGRDPARVFEGRHRLAQHVGLAVREARAFDRDPHRLFLKERHAECLA